MKLEIDIKILKLLSSHGKLSKSDIYRHLHRHPLEEKNNALTNLLDQGLINVEYVYISPKAKNPSKRFSITNSGQSYLNSKMLIAPSN